MFEDYRQEEERVYLREREKSVNRNTCMNYLNELNVMSVSVWCGVKNVGGSIKR